ncbi:hypothetical protein AM500_05900 [Bacillus sp. FJAT-18017]|uniref:SH3 domain-containing protein n=1 Tax=Bacillus sp. FJAT-18017 TaxID=1705566 RepID=UPI0006ADBC6E|nr:SH3 domain-containing protein [Bacillus sp. FJAT-18017]ALC89367.1 hypothetical protein AM500_05900 [Bacillus sp. FJAT-18017]
MELVGKGPGMAGSKLIKWLVAFILAIGIFVPFNRVEAAATTGVVDVKSGLLNVRSGPGTKYKVIGTLKNKTKVTVYFIKNGWAQIKYKSKKAYVSDNYLRFYKKMSAATAEKITDRAISIQRVTWERNYTKAKIYSIMAPGFTKGFTDRYFKQQFRTAGKDKSGTPLFHVIETEIWGLAIYPIDWELDYEPKKPTITNYVKNGREYLMVSQYHVNEMRGNFISTIYFYKSGSKWLVYDHKD